LPDIAHESDDDLPWDDDEDFEDDFDSDDDHEWQTHSDIALACNGYSPRDLRFNQSDSFPSGIERTSPPPQLTDQQKVAIDMILCGKKLKTIARKLGIHPGTLWRWRRYDLDFRRALTAASQKGLMHSIEQLRQLVPKAVDIVHSNIDQENFQAAIHVLRLVHRHLDTYEHLAS
jgi:transposase-like protein